MLSLLNTYIYVAGHDKVKEGLDKAFADIMGSQEKWEARKAELIAGKKWVELIY
jgi:ferredoxin--NADP+ reductase